MKEPISTYTNLAYVIVAALLFPELTFISVFCLGIASGTYHYFGGRKDWRNSVTARYWDARMMYFTFNSIIGHLIYVNTGEVYAPILMVVLLTAWMWYHREHYSSTYVSAWQVTIGGTLSYVAFDSLWFLPIFAIAYLCNIPFLNDFHRHHGWSHFWVDLLHGIWHILTAIAIYGMATGF